MFTDVYFTNRALPHAGIAFHHGQVLAGPVCGPVFKAIRCPYGWMHRFRIPWQLNFRLVRSPGNSSHPYMLKHSFKPEKKQFLISMEGIITVQQSYGNGKQIIDFEQEKGKAYCGIQIYRGKFLVAEAYFSGKYLQFQLDETVSVIQNFVEGMEITPAANSSSGTLKFDLSGLKAIYLEATDPNQNKLIVRKQEQW